jgi:hypothetical protein
VIDSEFCNDHEQYKAYSLCNDFIALGVIFTSGEKWQEQRKVALEILREFGLGTNILAEKIQTEVCTAPNRKKSLTKSLLVGLEDYELSWYLFTSVSCSFTLRAGIWPRVSAEVLREIKNPHLFYSFYHHFLSAAKSLCIEKYEFVFFNVIHFLKCEMCVVTV